MIEPLKIIWLSDFDFVSSGYFNISIPLCTGLSEKGHVVKAVGIGYKGQEHFYPFSIIPCSGIQESIAILQGIYRMWQFDVLVVAMDLYVHNPFLQTLQQYKPFSYIGISPVEAPPLCMTWAMVLSQLDKPFIISEFGTKTAQEAGVLEAEHLQVGIDTEKWKPASPEERQTARSSMLGLEDDTFVILQVADNQERKNLAAAMEIFKEFSKDKKALYVLVTRENSPVGWRLRDYAQELGILNKFMLFERGMPVEQLRMLYAAADCFLLTSKSEGLGMPLLEAMAMKLPCIGTDCTGIAELLGNGRGFLVPHEYIHRDPFGNGKRWWINKHITVQYLNEIFTKEVLPKVDDARQYVEDLDWQPSILRIEEVMLKLREARTESKKEPNNETKNEPS